MNIEFTDRYQALGIPYPDPKTICEGQCEGTGFYPLKLDDLTITESERAAWVECHNTPDAHKDEPCDGWHFIKCAGCGGTGLRNQRLNFQTDVDVISPK